MDALFPPVSLSKILGEVVSEAGLKQLRMAAGEKYPHVAPISCQRFAKRPPIRAMTSIMVPSPEVAMASTCLVGNVRRGGHFRQGRS